MNPRFDLIDIIRTLSNRRRFIILCTVAAGLAGALFQLAGKKEYKAKAEALVFNPSYSDRNHFFRTTSDRYIDYFAGEDDIDRIFPIARSEALSESVAKQLDLFRIYRLDPADSQDVDKFHSIWKKKFSFKRTEYKHVEISYSHEDARTAADIVNASITTIEELYRGTYNLVKLQIEASLQDKITEADSVIIRLTDSLALLRETYGIYDIVSPNRLGHIYAPIKSNGKKDFAFGLEQIQNLSSIKDQYVIDRAKYISLQNEFNAGTKPHELLFLKAITTATPPVRHAGPGLLLTVALSVVIGLIASSVIVLLNEYFRFLLTEKK